MLSFFPNDTRLPDPAERPEFYDGVTRRRALAFVLDGIAILLLFLVSYLIFGIMTLGIGFLFAGPFLLLLTSWGYRALSLMLWSATPGMRLLGIEFRTAQGERFDTGHAVLHSLGYQLLFMTMIGQVASAMMMILTPRGQGIPDLVLGSTALHAPE